MVQYDPSRNSQDVENFRFIIKDDNYLDEKDILRILVESGLLGRYKRHDLIKADSDIFKNKNIIKIITTLPYARH